VLWLSGCATDAPKTPNYFAERTAQQDIQIERVVLAIDPTPPQIESIELGLTKGEGAASGAAAGAFAGLNALLHSPGSCSGSYCGAAYALLIPIFVVGGAMVGAVSGGESGYSAEKLAEAESKAQKMLTSGFLQTQILSRAKKYAQENADLEFIGPSGINGEVPKSLDGYEAVSGERVDAILEIRMKSLTLKTFLEMEAQARLISAETEAVLSYSFYRFQSERRDLKEWMGSGAAALTEAIERGLQTLAEDLVDENFLLFYPRESEKQFASQANEKKESTEGDPVPHYVLQPLYPQLDTCFFCEGFFDRHPHRAIGNLEFVTINTVRPTFRWEKFPRPEDTDAIDGNGLRITDVSYEVRIFDSAIPSGTDILLVPGQLVYSSRNILENFHKIRRSLEPCKDYFWTVRARFKLDGRIRVTEWSGAFDVSAWNEKPWNLRRGMTAYEGPPEWIVLGLTGYNPIIPDGPEWFYFPFSTPCD
jgi:hypothetical protein